MDTWEVGVPGSSSTVTVSSSNSGASGIVASETWLPGLCSWQGGSGRVLVGGPSAHPPWSEDAPAGLDAKNAFVLPLEPTALGPVSAPAGEDSSMFLSLG